MQRGAAEAKLKITVRKFRQREEAMLVRHAEQLSKMEARLGEEKRKYDDFAKQKVKYEADAFAKLGELCFEAAAQRIRGFSGHHGDQNSECHASKNSRSRSPRRS